jgi:hypothetical protein
MKGSRLGYITDTVLSCRVNFLEIGFSVFLFLCASYNLVFHGTRSYYLYMYLQGLAFLLLGLNFTGTCSCCQ